MTDAGGLQDIKALRRDLQALPQRPTQELHPRAILARTKRALDFVGHARPGPAMFFAAVNPYPKPFQHVRFRTEDGVTIVGWYGPPHDGGVGDGDAPTEDGPRAMRQGTASDASAAPQSRHSGAGDRAMRQGTASDASAAPQSPPFGLVIVPGMFSTKDDTIHKRRAIRIWRHWKVPILVIDQRAFGESKGIATAGWKEALDVHGAAKELARLSGVTRVGVISESMGGAAALNAVAHDCQSGTDLLTGGTLCWSAFVDARDAVGYISAKPPKDSPFRSQWGGFRWMLRLRSHGGYDSFDTYLADAARVNGLRDLDELYDLANPKWKVSLMHQPLLLVHATDDPVVPVRHARRMERYAADIPHIATLITNWGGHTGFESLDPHWFWEVSRRLFGAVNGVELPNLAGLR